MTERTTTAGVQAELVKQRVTPVFLMSFDFSVPVYFWTGVGVLSWDGHTWQGSGTVIKMAGIQETQAVQAMGMTFQIEGVDSELVSLALSEPVQGRDAKLWLGFLDASGALITDPVGPFGYMMDTIGIDEDPRNPVITLTCESRLARLDKAKVRRYTHEDQQIDFPGDEGLAFVTAIQEKSIVWRDR